MARHTFECLLAWNSPRAHNSARPTDIDSLPQAVQALGGDPVFRQVQDSAMDSLFYNPSQRASAALGLRSGVQGGMGGRQGGCKAPSCSTGGAPASLSHLCTGSGACTSRSRCLASCRQPDMLMVHLHRLPLSKAQLYDTWVQHGSADPQSPVFARSANGIISCALDVLRVVLLAVAAYGVPCAGAPQRMHAGHPWLFALTPCCNALPL